MIESNNLPIEVNANSINESELNKDMVAPMMIIRHLVRTYCENNNMIESLNGEKFENICNFLYEKYVK